MLLQDSISAQGVVIEARVLHQCYPLLPSRWHIGAIVFIQIFPKEGCKRQYLSISKQSNIKKQNTNCLIENKIQFHATYTVMGKRKFALFQFYVFLFGDLNTNFEVLTNFNKKQMTPVQK